MFCKVCGASLPEMDSYCKMCGTEINQSSGGNGFWDLFDESKIQNMREILEQETDDNISAGNKIDNFFADFKKEVNAAKKNKKISSRLRDYLITLGYFVFCAIFLIAGAVMMYCAEQKYNEAQQLLEEYGYHSYDVAYDEQQYEDISDFLSVSSTTNKSTTVAALNDETKSTSDKTDDLSNETATEGVPVRTTTSVAAKTTTATKPTTTKLTTTAKSTTTTSTTTTTIATTTEITTAATTTETTTTATTATESTTTETTTAETTTTTVTEPATSES